MVDLAAKLDKHLIPDLASIVLEYCQLEHVDEVINGRRHVYTMLFGDLHGEYNVYYSTGELMCSEHYVNSKLHDEYKRYDRNGELLYFEHYVNSKRHGECKWYRRTGEMYHSEHFINGVKQ